MTGSKASEGVSPADMTKRHNLERVKTQVLKNLNRFVSRNRLSIHNLPLRYDNDSLRDLIITYTGLTPHECRVMRENKVTAEYPMGRSKGFGFMSFNTHLNALTALRKLNNNPEIFGSLNRPIVGFSIEDKTVHKIKEKRLQKSRSNNPTYQQKLENRKSKGKEKLPVTEMDKKILVQRQIKKHERNSKPKFIAENTAVDFVGEEARPGSFVKMRSLKKIHAQYQEHKVKVGQLKKISKRKREKSTLRKEMNQLDRPKPKERPYETSDSFTDLVKRYKRKIDCDEMTSLSRAKRKKWYTE